MDKEITALWEKIGELERKLSAFTEMRHEESSTRISDNEEALCDLDESYFTKVADIEEALCDLSETI